MQMVSVLEGTAYRCGVVFLQQIVLFSLMLVHGALAATRAAAPVARDLQAGHHLVVDDEGAVWGWGARAYGQLGPGTGEGWHRPKRLASVPMMVRAVAGGRHSLAVDLEGQVWGWGDNSSGQLGLGHTKPTDAPMQVPVLTKIEAVSAGLHHSLALSQDGSVWAWGGNSHGQLGFGPIGAFQAVTKPTRVKALSSVPMISIVAGGAFSASLGKDGSVWTWGRGGEQVRRAEGLGAVAQLKAQAERIMARGKDGRVWTWIPASPDSAARPERSSEEAFRAFAPDDRELVMILSGSVTSASGKGVANASILAQRIPCANASVSGRFVCVLPRDWRGSLQAVKSGLRFEAQRVNSASSDNNPHDQTTAAALRFNFVAVNPLLKITGRLSSAGRGSRVQASGDGAHCQPVNPNGRYTCAVPKGWRGSLTATRPGYAYPTRTYASVRSTLTRQDFVGQRVAGVRPAASPSPLSPPPTQAIAASAPAPVPARASAGGAAPAEATQAAPLQDIPRMPVAATLPSPDLRITGTIYASGFGDAQASAGARRIRNATISADGAQCTGTDEAGNYLCKVKAGWTGRIVPRKPNYRFTPSALVFGGLRQDQRNQDFTAIYAPNED